MSAWPAALILALLPACVGAACADGDVPQAVALVLRAETSVRHAPVWPRYSLLHKPLLLYDEERQRAWLIGHPHPPPEFRHICEDGTGVFLREGPFDIHAPDFAFSLSVDGSSCFAYRFKPGSSVQTGVQTLVHENFHAFQDDAFVRGEAGHRPGAEDPENRALAALEQRALLRAVQASDPSLRERYARFFVAIRDVRTARWEGALEGNEDWEELTEGTADYVERHLMGRLELAGESGEAGPAVTAARLRAVPSTEDMGKNRSYATGSAMCWLLDRTGSTAWKDAAAAGSSLAALVAAKFPVAEAVRAGLISDAKRELLGFDAMLDDLRAADDQARREREHALVSYRTAEGIELHVPGLHGTASVSWRSSGATFRLDDESSLHSRVEQLDVEADGFKLSVQDRAVLEGDGWSFHVPGTIALILDGRAAPRSARRTAFKTLRLTAPGVTLETSRPGMWTPGRAGVTIE